MAEELVNHVLELLAPLGRARSRRMFGGQGFYVDDLFIALIADGRLYLKVDAQSRAVFESAGCEPFAYQRAGGERAVMSYFSAPDDAMESPALMQPWARLALAAAVRALPGTRLPDDTGVHAGQPIGELGFVAVTGDIANRAEPGVQSAAASWQEFLDTFVAPLNAGRAAPLPMIVATGNHDASNAIGYVPALTPRTDTAAMAGLLRLIDPVQYAQRPPFDYTRDRIHYVRRLDGVALMVLHIWPDSAERAWMEQELSSIPDSVPVLLFAHDPPMVDISHFTAPGGGPPGTGGFQALLTEQWQGAPLPGARFEGSPTLEGFRELVRRHRNVRAYFHGHQNWTEFHALREADGTALLPAFRVDSPLKGRDSATDDTKLSFLVVTLDAARQRLTVREYRWDHVSAASRWGPQATILLR